MNSSTTLALTNFNNFAASPVSSSAASLSRNTADFLVRVATKRQYVRALQALRRR